MRDIRDDLRERLDTITAEKRRLEEQLASLTRQEASVKTLLADEDDRWSRMQPKLFSGNGQSQRRQEELTGTPLSKMIREILSDDVARSAREIGDLVKQQGYPFGEKHPSRAVHFALIAMEQSKLVEGQKGVWKLGRQVANKGNDTNAVDSDCGVRVKGGRQGRC